MTIEQMHYDFKKKFNKIDSQQYRNYLVTEIDWVLNEAQELFVKMVAEPRVRSYLGFEKSQRNIDDIRTVVVTPKSNPTASIINVVDNVAELPEDYWFFIKAQVEMSKGSCTEIKARVFPRQHDDEFEESSFDNSNFAWRTVNATFFQGGIRLYDDGTFTNDKLCLTYIKRLRYIHNAKDFRGGQYKLSSGEILTGSVNCELPEGTHREIVDLAVAIASGEINSPEYQNKLHKLSFNQLK